MKLDPRTLLPLLGLALFAPAASAQLEPYITEAVATVELVFNTHVRQVDPTDSNKYITQPIQSRLTNITILEQLKNQGKIASTEDVTKWDLVAVHSAPSDVVYVNGSYYLYAAKKDRSVTVALGDIFTTTSAYSVRTNEERHQGRNIISSSGTVVNYTTVDFTPLFSTPPRRGPITTVGGSRFYTETNERYQLNDLSTSGYSTISYVATNNPVFYCAIKSLRFSATGDFSGAATQVATNYELPLTPPGQSPIIDGTQENPSPTDVPTFGLVLMRVSLNPVTLVKQSLYPDVPFADFVGL
jgi:hypothetical protein